MLMAYLTLLSGLLISGVAIFYSVAGLTSIFSAAVWPIIIMGVSLEVAKLVATVWVKQNWSIAPRLLKGYLVGAVVVLMIITSLGIFGFLSKAHSDQTLVSGDVGAKIAVYDEKIKIAKENIDANRKALKQMDEAVDQVMGRSTDEKGADKAVQIRRSQQKERARLQSEIAAEQKTISQLSEERAPIAAEVRKVEAEVGPIKYIAAFVYGENPDASILEKAVTWVIILIVVVFDPLAVMLLLASQYSFALLRPKEEQPSSIEEHFDEVAEALNDSLDESSAADLPVDSDPPIPSFLLKKNQPEEDLDAINLELAEAAVVPEPEAPVIEYQILEDTDDEEFIIEVPEVHYSNTDNPIDFPDAGIQITHTPEGMLIEDSAGFQEIPVETPKPVIQAVGSEYVMVDGKMYHHKAFDSDSKGAEHLVQKHNPTSMDERPGDYVEPAKTYVQNEEQQESGVWTQIASKTITEEEYLKAVQQKQKGE
jgi:hypothetical protein